MNPGQRRRLRTIVYARDNGECVYCRSRYRLTLDHRIPKSQGGKNTPENCVTCCYSCNRQKGTMSVEAFLAWMVKHPGFAKSNLQGRTHRRWHETIAARFPEPLQSLDQPGQASAPPHGQSDVSEARSGRQLAPDPWGLTPSGQRRLDGRSREALALQVSADQAARKPTECAIIKAVAQLFETAAMTPPKTHASPPVHRRPQPMPHPAAGTRRRKTTVKADQAATRLFDTAPAQQQAAERQRKALPELTLSFTTIRESVFTLPDPDGLYKSLEEGLSLREALTPNALLGALNTAEDFARLAHKLYVVANADYERFERECEPIVESMRDAANRELQSEKDSKLRSKAITDADLRGRAAVMFPDEWAAMDSRRIKASGMLNHLKALAELWKTRCYSLNGMLNAGKRA